MATNHLPAGETTHQILSTVPQTFPISQPFVYIQGDNQGDLEAARAKLYYELGLLPPNSDWAGEGWVKDQEGNYAYMIQAPTPAPQNVSNPMELVETRDQRHERINKLREEALQREAAQPKKSRERRSQPDGYLDKRIQQKQRAEERRITKREYRRSHPITHRAHQGGKTIPQAPSANSIMTRAKAKLRRQNNEGDGTFYFGSEKSFSSQKAREIEKWTQEVKKEKAGNQDVDMEDV
ncbi:MAG: hypothetical protein Q9209_006568 [Squamulea sp. 1 TL-2023]